MSFDSVEMSTARVFKAQMAGFDLLRLQAYSDVFFSPNSILGSLHLPAGHMKKSLYTLIRGLAGKTILEMLMCFESMF